MLDLNPINERLDKATPGPWRHGCNRYGWSVFTAEHPIMFVGDLWSANGKHQWEPDAELIANAPTDLRACIDEIEKARGIIDLYMVINDCTDPDCLPDHWEAFHDAIAEYTGVKWAKEACR